MSTKTTPATTTVNCDICGIECNHSNRAQSGRLIVECDLLDFQGAPVANGGFQRDLCDRCLVGLTDALRIKAEALAAARKEEGNG